MTDAGGSDVAMEDDYDEEADSDFDARDASDGALSPSSGSDADQHVLSKEDHAPPQHLPKKKHGRGPAAIDLDSGDEATIKETKRQHPRPTRKGNDEPEYQSENSEPGLRVKTRASREKAQAEKRKAALASVKGSTIDVDKIWKEMNAPGGLDTILNPNILPRTDDGSDVLKENNEPAKDASAPIGNNEADGCIRSHSALNETITIDEAYEFAGEVHHRKKTVPRSSTQAKLWLSKRSAQNTDPRFPGDEPIRRPLRKISRFDPNISNLDPFRQMWEKPTVQDKKARVDKLNTVDKSKMDWLVHVDQEGLQDELTEHSRTKGAYLARMEFLGQVEQRQTEMGRNKHPSG